MSESIKDYSEYLEHPVSPYQYNFVDFCKDKLEHHEPITVIDEDETIDYSLCYKTTMYGETCWVIDALESDQEGISWINEKDLKKSEITKNMITTSPMSTSDLIAAEMNFVSINDDYLDQILEYWDDLYMDESIESTIGEISEPAQIEM